MNHHFAVRRRRWMKARMLRIRREKLPAVFGILFNQQAPFFFISPQKPCLLRLTDRNLRSLLGGRDSFSILSVWRRIPFFDENFSISFRFVVAEVTRETVVCNPWIGWLHIRWSWDFFSFWVRQQGFSISHLCCPRSRFWMRNSVRTFAWSLWLCSFTTSRVRRKRISMARVEEIC